MKCVRHQGATHLSHPIRIAFRFRKVRFEDSRDIDICVLIHPKDQVERPRPVGGVVVVWLFTSFRDEIFVSIFVPPITRVLYFLGERVMWADTGIEDGDFDIWDTAPSFLPDAMSPTTLSAFPNHTAEGLLALNIA